MYHRFLVLLLSLAAWLACAPSAADLDTCRDVFCTAGVCQLEAGEPRCICMAKDKLLGRSCRVLTSYVDDHGDTLAEATPLASGEWIDGLINARRDGSADVDWFSVEASSGGSIDARCTAGDALSCRLRLYGPDGTLLEERTGLHLRVVLKVAAGPVFVSVASEHGSLGSYAFSVSVVPDDLGDGPGEAARVGPGDGGVGALEVGGDQDVFRVDPRAGRSHRFVVDSPTSVRLRLLRSTGSAVLERAGTRVMLSTRDQQPLFFEVSGAEVAGYRWSVTEAALDDLPDTAQGAPTFEVPVELTGTLEVDADVDVVMLRSPARGLYEVRCTSDFEPSCTATVPGVLRTGGGVLLDLGTYETRVEGAATTYRYSARLLAADDHGDAEASATLVSTGEHTGALQWIEDVDVFRFEVEPDHIYTASCRALTGACDMGLRGGANTARLPYPAQGLRGLAPGPAYANVSGGPGEYVVEIEDRGIDEDRASTTVAGAPRMTDPQPGAINYPGDRDCYLRLVGAGRRYTISVTGPSMFQWQAGLGASWTEAQTTPFTIQPAVTGDAIICVLAATQHTDVLPYTLSVVEG